MPSRFCSQCGAATTVGANFCGECGVDLRTGSPRPTAAAARPVALPAPGWQVTTSGLGALGILLVSGLAIWAGILTPEPPKPAPGRGGPPAAAAGAGAAAPAGGAGAEATAKPVMELPAEVKRFITDLAAKAAAAPDDLATWVRLGQVYYRAAQLDPSYYPEAMRAFDHVLARNASEPEALRGKANVFYDRSDHAQAIPLFERFLVLSPDDPSAKTDLATMYHQSGDAPKAITMYSEVIAKNPAFLQAHYNLAVTHAQLGETEKALAEFRTARDLATDDTVRKQIDDMMVRLGGPPPAGAPAAPVGAPAGTPAAPAPAVAAGPRTPFQEDVEKRFRDAPIMGERIARFEWTGPTTGQVVVSNFPMAGMPPEVREKFTTRLSQELRSAASTAQVAKNDVKLEITDAGGTGVMATVTP